MIPPPPGLSPPYLRQGAARITLVRVTYPIAPPSVVISISPPLNPARSFGSTLPALSFTLSTCHRHHTGVLRPPPGDCVGSARTAPTASLLRFLPAPPSTPPPPSVPSATTPRPPWPPFLPLKKRISTVSVDKASISQAVNLVHEPPSPLQIMPMQHLINHGQTDPYYCRWYTPVTDAFLHHPGQNSPQQPPFPRLVLRLHVHPPNPFSRRLRPEALQRQ